MIQLSFHGPFMNISKVAIDEFMIANVHESVDIALNTCAQYIIPNAKFDIKISALAYNDERIRKWIQNRETKSGCIESLQLEISSVRLTKVDFHEAKIKNIYLSSSQLGDSTYVCEVECSKLSIFEEATTGEFPSDVIDYVQKGVSSAKDLITVENGKSILDSTDKIHNTLSTIDQATDIRIGEFKKISSGSQKYKIYTNHNFHGNQYVQIQGKTAAKAMREIKQTTNQTVGKALKGKGGAAVQVGLAAVSVGSNYYQEYHNEGQHLASVEAWTDPTKFKETKKSMLEAGGSYLGAKAGIALGAKAGLLCGPYAVICSPVGMIIGGIAGAHYGGESLKNTYDYIENYEVNGSDYASVDPVLENNNICHI
jgi:hypothetical protein